jgi:hypothetical protein
MSPDAVEKPWRPRLYNEEEPMQPMTIVSPVAQFRDAGQGSFKHASRSGLAAKRVLLLPAEKSSSPPFVRVLAERLGSETAIERAFMRNPDWAFFHPERTPLIDAEVEALARECDAVVSGVAY